MIAMLRKVADPGRGEGAQWANMRIHRIATERVTEPRLDLEADHRVALPDRPARRGPAHGARPSSARTATPSASARRSTSTPCSRRI